MRAAGLTRFALALALCLGASVPGHARSHRAADAAVSEAAGSTRDLYLLLIRQARADGRPRAALAYLADFDRRHPGDIDAAVLRVNCLLDLGKVGEAQAALARLPANSPGGEASAVRGHVFAAQGNWARAITQYREALAAGPANPLTRNALGYALLRVGQVGEALETLRAAADLAPDDVVIRNNLLLALTLAGQTAEAQAAIARLADATARATLRGQLAQQVSRLAVGSAAARGGL